MESTEKSLGIAPLVQPPGQYWGRSSNRKGTQSQSVGAPAAPASVASGASAPLSLDYRTYVSPPPQPTEAGEWHVQLTSVDEYAEVLAVEDPDGSLGRSCRKAEGVADPASDVDGEPLDLAVLDFEEMRDKNARAARRAKRNLKWKVRMLRADRLWTLTARGGIETYADAWEYWGRFERYCSRRFPAFKCIVVPELHKSGKFHLHFVTDRFFDVNSMRLWWHRCLTGLALVAPLRGDESPGNIDVSRVLVSGKLCAYLGKYLSKTFETYHLNRVKRYACSKWIGEPQRRRSRMSATCGEHVYRLRRYAESEGLRVEGLFEGSVAGRRLVWMKCKVVRSREGPS